VKETIMARARIGRRQFLGGTAGTALWALSPAARALGAGARILGANDRIRLGIIGPGARGKELLGQLLKLVNGGSANADLVAAADVYTRRLEEVRKNFPAVKTFADHRRLLDMKDVDAVIVASPLHCHARHFLDTLAAGKDLYSEKTMTWSIAEAEECRRAAKQSGRVVQIGLQHVSTGAFIDAKQWVNDGLVGKVTHVESWMSRNTPRGEGQWVRKVPADCTADNVNWDLFLNGRQSRPFDGFRFINWRLYWEFSGGNVTENAVHQFSWIMQLLDLPVPSAAYMSGGIYSEKDGREVPDTIAITLDFPDNDLVVTWQSTFSNKRYGLGERVLGTHGTIERVSDATDMVTGNLKGGARYYPEKVNRADGAPLVGRSKDVQHLGNFLDCVRSRNEPNATVELGYRTAVAAHMANLAYRQKERITLSAAMSTSAQAQR
jgi:predicted dehydrogenase